MKKKTRKLITCLFLVVFLIFATIKWLDSNAPVTQAATVTASSEDPFYLGDVKGSGLEIPAYINGHQVVQHTGYTLSYNEEYEVATYWQVCRLNVS